MPTILIDNREIEIPSRAAAQWHRSRQAGRHRDSLLLLASRACRWWAVAACAWSRSARAIRRRARSPCNRSSSPACNTWMTDNMVLVTNSEKVARARAMVEEGLLLRHPIDCPICDKAGECILQDYHFRYGQGERRADLRPFTSRRRDLGDVTLFVDRCVLCSRCVRFTAEISGTNELMFTGRGAHEEIDVVPGFPLEQQALRQRGRSLPGRGAGRQGLSLSSSGCGSCGGIAASAPAAPPAARSGSRRTRTASTGSSRARTRL